MRPPDEPTPARPPGWRRLRPAAAVLLGTAGIVLAVIVLIASRSR